MRKGSDMTWPTVPTRRAGIAVVGIALVAAACSGTSEPTGNVASGRAIGDAERIVAVDTAFKPAILEAEAGDEVTLEITNKEDISHDLAVESAGLNTGTIESGDTATATFTMPDSPVDFVCTYHDGMAGRIEPR
jgi:plastocyanin